MVDRRPTEPPDVKGLLATLTVFDLFVRGLPGLCKSENISHITINYSIFCFFIMKIITVFSDKRWFIKKKLVIYIIVE